MEISIPKELFYSALFHHEIKLQSSHLGHARSRLAECLGLVTDSRYTKGVPFLSKLVYKMVNFVECPPPGGGGGPKRRAESRAEFELNNCSPKIPNNLLHENHVARGFACEYSNFDVIGHQAQELGQP